MTVIDGGGLEHRDVNNVGVALISRPLLEVTNLPATVQVLLAFDNCDLSLGPGYIYFLSSFFSFHLSDETWIIDSFESRSSQHKDFDLYITMQGKYTVTSCLFLRLFRSLYNLL